MVVDGVEEIVQYALTRVLVRTVYTCQSIVCTYIAQISDTA